jgi:hypothetical protein
VASAWARLRRPVDERVDRWRRTRGYESTGLRAFLYRLGGPVKSLAARVWRAPDVYVTSAPSPQNVLDLFEGEWSSALPAPYGAYRAGALPLFADERLVWGVERLGGAAGKTVLELGPLEGGHTYMLERMGASAITAVEAHPRAYLRCLAVKELLGLTRARFLLGDFQAYLREDRGRRFDFGIASGVLYHMTEPVDLLGALAEACDGLYIWTHHFEATEVVRRPKLQARFGSPERRLVRGFEHTVHPHRYGADRFKAAFCGAGDRTVAWLDRETILAALRHFGFEVAALGLEEPGHLHGPALGLVARRRASSAG